ncbi:hypothetical protein [Xylanibacillus composti]|uniref:hypothetical protein n=1 Tax=Xylanibacillus composti TaxID=1572762 RepID=UPI001BCE1BFE|nr:hypothetical protein [Xylanibacillus composti]
MRQSRRQRTAGKAQHQLLHNTIRESLDMEELQASTEAGADWAGIPIREPESPRPRPMRTQR